MTIIHVFKEITIRELQDRIDAMDKRMFARKLRNLRTDILGLKIACLSSLLLSMVFACCTITASHSGDPFALVIPATFSIGSTVAMLVARRHWKIMSDRLYLTFLKGE